MPLPLLTVSSTYALLGWPCSATPASASCLTSYISAPRGATVMSYFIAGVSAFLSSLCYSEYAVEFPVAGGSFTFILYTFGEFWAWITATNLIFNYGTPSLGSSFWPGLS